MILSSTKHYHNHTTTTSSTATPLSPSGVISVCQAVSTDPRVYVAADCAVLEQRSCHSDTDTEIEACAQRQRHGRSRRAPPKPVINNVTMRTPKASDKQHHRLAQLSLYSSVHVRNAVCCVKFYASVRAQRQRHRRSRRAPPVLRQVLMHRHRRGHSTRTRVASSATAPPPPRSFHEGCTRVASGSTHVCA